MKEGTQQTSSMTVFFLQPLFQTKLNTIRHLGRRAGWPSPSTSQVCIYNYGWITNAVIYFRNYKPKLLCASGVHDFRQFRKHHQLYAPSVKLSKDLYHQHRNITAFRKKTLQIYRR
jgi:hypothetical protein